MVRQIFGRKWILTTPGGSNIESRPIGFIKTLKLTSEVKVVNTSSRAPPFRGSFTSGMKSGITEPQPYDLEWRPTGASLNRSSFTATRDPVPLTCRMVCDNPLIAWLERSWFRAVKIGRVGIEAFRFAIFLKTITSIRRRWLLIYHSWRSCPTFANLHAILGIRSAAWGWFAAT